jgi:lipopolysaccharide export system protein LptA
MTADDAARKVTFTGKVVARQGDLIISCDRMLVSYVPRGSYSQPPKPEGANGAQAAQGAASGQAAAQAPPGAAAPPAPGGQPEGRGRSPLEGGQEIDQVTCQGAVKIQQRDRLAVGDTALYLARALPRRLVLTGAARVWQGENSITGHQITYYLDENRSLVTSEGASRVRAFYGGGSGGQ